MKVCNVSVCLVRPVTGERLVWRKGVNPDAQRPTVSSPSKPMLGRGFIRLIAKSWLWPASRLHQLIAFASAAPRTKAP
jgi:hypothetical protein